MSREIWHIADEDGNPICGAKDCEAATLADPENIEDADRNDRLCRECAL